MRTARKQLIPVENRAGRIIVVTGHKGGGEYHGRRKPGTGSGESATGRIALIDLGRPFPDVGTFMDQESNYSIVDLTRILPIWINLSSKESCSLTAPDCQSCTGYLILESRTISNWIAWSRSLPLCARCIVFVVIHLSHSWLDELFMSRVG